MYIYFEASRYHSNIRVDGEDGTCIIWPTSGQTVFGKLYYCEGISHLYILCIDVLYCRTCGQLLTVNDNFNEKRTIILVYNIFIHEYLHAIVVNIKCLEPGFKCPKNHWKML